MKDSTVFQSQLADEAVRKELAESTFVEETLNEMSGGLESVKSADLSESVEQMADGQSDPTRPNVLEAIVMRHGYPSLLIKDGDYERPKLKVWQKRLDPKRKEIKSVIQGVGRVELEGHPDAKWVGTCWLVDEETLVTNRHVADFFTEIKRSGISIQRGVKAYVDFREEHLAQEELEYLISSVSFIEQDDRDIDMALMKLDAKAAQRLRLQPIPLASTHEKSEFIGVVGYPARDSRNPIQDMSRIFQDIYNVKRLAPGMVMDSQARSKVFTHNCTTLGGNSGSVVFDISTGEAIGLHFAGSALDANYAVNAHWLKDRLKKNSVLVSNLPSSDDQSDNEIELEARENFDDRDGYQVDFLGDDELRVPLPRLNELQARDVVESKDGEKVLKYRHFSVVLSKRRKLAYYSAANLDGDDMRRPKRVKKFRLDPRVKKNQQAGEALYASNDLDRGHMIRRLDPSWGSSDIAKQANRDSNFFPNIGPQHKDLNRRVWLDLEDHILSNTDEENAKVSVFVGCVFDEDDPPHQDSGIKVPMGFWKVVASTARRRRGRRNVRELQSQAFVFFQDHLVQQSDLELIFGGIEGVQQITVAELERITGLDFGVLRCADTFGMDPDFEEGVDFESPIQGRTAHYRLLNDASDMV